MTNAQALERAALEAALFDDNPATLDLLGFDAVVAPVLAALQRPDLDPITIGIHAPWGGGKSSVLNLLEASKHKNWIIVRTSPWEYEDQLDPKTTMIAEVLEDLRAQVDPEDKLIDKFTGLLHRVSWSKVGVAIAKGAVTMQWNPAEILDAFTLKDESPQQSMAKFRKEFAQLLFDLPRVERVVVLVDDLDRCLPEAVVATLEAIKLFLSVKKMAFVIAADQEMVREAIAASLVGTNRGEMFAQNYLEKIVQLPVSLPRLSPVEAECYIALLLTPRADETGYDALVEHAATRRRAHQQPLLGSLDGLAVRPSEAVLALAAQINQGLAPSDRGNPREIKRFLNAFGVRSQIARARGLTLDADVMVKLLLLETRYSRAFERLAGLPDSERLPVIEQWEAWGRGERDDPPAEIGEATKGWAAAEPRLRGEDLSPYITLAATLVAASLGAPLTDVERQLVRALLDESPTERLEGAETLKGLGADDARKITRSLLAEARGGDQDAVTRAIDALVVVGKAHPDLAGDIAQDVREGMWSRLDEGAAISLATSEVPEFVALVRDLATDERVRAGIREAAKIQVEG